MSYNAGDFDTTETVDIPFNTFTSDDPAASSTITNLVAGDLHIHKDGGLTQRSSSAGVTISVNFDSITGNHVAHIDLSDNTDAGFYADGSRYLVRMEGTTVDAGTINAWIGGFSIGCSLRPTTAGRTLDVNATGEAGLDLDNTSGTLAAAQFGADCITAAKIAPSAITKGDQLAGLNDVSTADVNAQCDASIVTYHLDHLLAADYDPASKPGVATALLNELVESDAGVSRYTANALEQAPTGGSAPTVGEIADAVWDETASAHLTVGSFGEEVQGHTLVYSQISSITSTTQFRLTAGSTIDDIYNGMQVVIYDDGDRANAYTGLVVTYTGSTKEVQVTPVPDFTVNTSDTVRIVPGPDIPTPSEIADQVWNEDITTDHKFPNTAGFMVQGATLLSAEIDTVTDQTNYTLATGSDKDDAYLNQTVVFLEEGNSDYQSVRKCTGYTGSTKAIVVDSAPDFTVDTTDSVRILVSPAGSTAPTASQIVDEWETQSQADPTGFHVNVQEVSGTAQTANDNGADINTLITQIGTAGAGLTDLGGMSTAMKAEVTAATFTLQMTESYAADGVAPTPAQALFAIQQFLQERSASGTTVTVKEVDGSTGAMTFTINDAVNPTSITRAT